MRKCITVLGILLTVTILISGSAIAQTWHYGVSVHGFVDCTNENEILGAPDTSNATIGVNGIPPNPDKLGEIVVNLSYNHEMGANQNFTVFASSGLIENYSVFIATEPSFTDSHFCGYGYDDQDRIFQTPSTPGKDWLYIKFVGMTGQPGQRIDPIYGPDIDAVGWESP